MAEETSENKACDVECRVAYWSAMRYVVCDPCCGRAVVLTSQGRRANFPIELGGDLHIWAGAAETNQAVRPHSRTPTTVLSHVKIDSCLKHRISQRQHLTETTKVGLLFCTIDRTLVSLEDALPRTCDTQRRSVPNFSSHYWRAPHTLWCLVISVCEGSCCSPKFFETSGGFLSRSLFVSAQVAPCHLPKPWLR